MTLHPNQENPRLILYPPAQTGRHRQPARHFLFERSGLGRDIQPFVPVGPAELKQPIAGAENRDGEQCARA